MGLKLSGELRLISQSIARLMRQVHVDVSEAPARTSQKAQKAARVRWSRGDVRAVG